MQILDEIKIYYILVLLMKIIKLKKNHLKLYIVYCWAFSHSDTD